MITREELVKDNLNFYAQMLYDEISKGRKNFEIHTEDQDIMGYYEDGKFIKVEIKNRRSDVPENLRRD